MGGASSVRSLPHLAGRWGLVCGGLVLGLCTAVVDAVFLVVAGGAVVAAPAAGRAVRGRVSAWVRAGALWLAGVERWRLGVFLGCVVEEGEYGGVRALRYLAVRVPVGLLGGAVVLLLVYGVGSGVVLLSRWVRGLEGYGMSPTPWIVAYVVVGGVVLVFLNLQGLVGMVVLERRVAGWFLGPSRRELLERRIGELAASRAGVVEVVDQERRRIERDLHDGVQQRLVALGVLLGRARRQGDSELLRQAHREAREVLRDLREVAWRVYPAALDTVGLRDALAAVVERSGVPVRLVYEVEGRLPRPVETAVYFVVCEAVTNAAKHSGAVSVSVEVMAAGSGVRVRVCDDGCGGADVSGGGLSGLARRVAALDGRFSVSSPVGGPTVVVAELPCVGVVEGV